MGKIRLYFPEDDEQEDYNRYQYSIDNGATWRTSHIFDSLNVGSYQVVLRNNSSGCTSAYNNNPITFSLPTCREVCNDGVDNDGDGDIDCVDTDCALVTTGFAVDVTQPTCPLGGNNGSIVISGAKNSTAAKTFFTLAPGDVAITQYDADPDQFTFITRQPIAAGTKLIFTDKGWVNNTSGLRTQEGLAEWTAPAGGLAVGASVTITRTNASATAGTVLFDEAIPNYAVYDSNDPNFDLSTAGDQLIALSAKSLDVSQIKQLTFLTAIQANGNSWESSATSDATSGLPPGLVNGSTARTVGKVAEANLIPYPALTPLYAFSVDGGVNFQNDSTFTNRFPGTYSIVIKNQSTGCTAPLGTSPVVLEVPTCPEICDNTIDDDGDGNADCADTDCAVPSYAVTYTQPGCPPVPIYGSITIAPYGNVTDYQYSIDSGATWQDSAFFANLNEGTYQIVVKRIASGCTLAYIPLTLQRPTCQEICNDSIDNDFDGLIDCADTTACGVVPYAITLTQPDCPPNPIYGTITITPYSSETYQYSLTNGTTWQDSTVFTGLGEGTYRITVRNGTSGCVETSDSLVLERPGCVEICGDGVDNDFNGLADCADTTSCGVASFAVTASNPVFVPAQVKGSITITPSDSKAYLYSIDSGVTRQAAPTFTDLEPGAYNVFVYSGQCEEEYEDNPVFLLKPKELCDQVGDEDGDGLADCADPECSTNPECTSATERTICYGDEVELGMDTDDCVSWEWEDELQDDHSNFIQVQPDKTTIYKMHITNDQGELVETKTFTVNVTPAVIIEPDVAIITDETGVEVEVIPNEPGYTYEWAHDAGITGATTTLTEPGTYTVQVTAPNGCTTTVSVDASIVSSEDVEVCKRECEEIGVTPIAGYTYEWNEKEKLEGSNLSSPQQMICPTESGMYSVDIINPDGFVVETKFFFVTVKHADFKVSPNPAILCAGQSVLLEALGENLGTGTNISWSRNGTNIDFGKTITVNQTGTYTVVATTDDGCQLTDEVKVLPPDDCNSIREWFIKNEFFVVPISSVRSENIVKAPQEKSGLGINIVDYANLILTIDGREINIEQYLQDMFGGLNTNVDAFVTTNEQLCDSGTNITNDNLFYQVKALWENPTKDLSIWVHICVQSDGSGLMFLGEKERNLEEVSSTQECPNTHPASLIVRIFNSKIYEAFRNSNNIRLCTFFNETRRAKESRRSGNDIFDHDLRRKSIGAIGEGIVASSIRYYAPNPSGIGKIQIPAKIKPGYKLSQTDPQSHVDIFVRIPLWMGLYPANTAGLDIEYNNIVTGAKESLKISWLEFSPPWVESIHEVKTFSDNYSLSNFYDQAIETGVNKIEYIFEHYNSKVDIGTLDVSFGIWRKAMLNQNIKNKMISKLTDLESLRTPLGISQAGFLRLAGNEETNESLHTLANKAFYALRDLLELLPEGLVPNCPCGQ